MLDDTRRLAGPLGADDDLGVGQVRQRVQRSAEYRQHAPDGQRKVGQQDQAAVGDGGADDRGDHGVGPASSVPAASAYFGTSCMSMNGDLPGLSKCLSGRIGSYQYKTSRSPCGSASAAPSMSGMASAVCPSGAPPLSRSSAPARLASESIRNWPDATTRSDRKSTRLNSVTNAHLV